MRRAGSGSSDDELSPLVESRVESLSFIQMMLLGAMMALISASSDAYLPMAPKIRREFGASLVMMSLALQLNWIISGVSGPMWGSVSTVAGRKPTLAAGLLVFVAGSAMSGLATSTGAFVCGRVVQGLGEGSARAIAEAIVCDVYEDEELRSRNLATMSQWFSVTIIVAPAFGGSVGSVLGWRCVFFLLLLFGLLLLLGMICVLPETSVSTSVSTTWSKNRRRRRGEDPVVESFAGLLVKVWESLDGSAASIVVGGLIFNTTTNSFAGTMLTLWPYTLEDEFGLDANVAGLFVGSIGIFGMLGAQMNKYASTLSNPATLLRRGIAFYGLAGASLAVATSQCFVDARRGLCSSLVFSAVVMYSLAILIFTNYPWVLTLMLADVPRDTSATLVGMNGGVMSVGLALSSISASVSDEIIFRAPIGDPRVLYLLLSTWVILGTLAYLVFIFPPTRARASQVAPLAGPVIES
ncbi:hypothetical protein CTAYLR_009434 [Chrysophaeum taylorii]|uniref:Major facilitator superfamily (MFS) profile domain-containing protein n=1 Tax=Chrysophaeum taylorii TaxID=2483200 RepID=A0AAD7XKT5_9STRA|nr:hypothetical protein CTAYLR_009434 [Chrysophaeum taylorii]